MTTGNANVAVGYHSLSSEDGNGQNVAVGNRTLANQNAGAEAFNVAVGTDAGLAVTTGIETTLSVR